MFAYSFWHVYFWLVKRIAVRPTTQQQWQLSRFEFGSEILPPSRSIASSQRRTELDVQAAYIYGYPILFTVSMTRSTLRRWVRAQSEFVSAPCTPSPTAPWFMWKKHGRFVDNQVNFCIHAHLLNLPRLLEGKLSRLAIATFRIRSNQALPWNQVQLRKRSRGEEMSGLTR